MTRRSLPGRIATESLGGLLAVVFAFPVYWMALSAFRPENRIQTSSYDLLPTSATFDNFSRALHKPGFLDFARNSLVVTLSSVVLAVGVAVLAAVALARLRFPGRRGFVLLVLVAQLAPFEALLIPMYFLMRDLDLVNHLTALVLIYLASTLPFTVWTLRGFVEGIPFELEEAAMVDGCSRVKAFWRVTFPLLGPGLVASSLYAFITAWNEFLYALVLMTDKANQTLPLWLTAFKTNFGDDWSGAMAASVVYSIPVLVFFAVLQRRMVGGLASGAVKG
ncbi:N,N'-diacetylchitobiose transport system permease protein [Motilibacter rhizosphaerae]|uniref:N,N'-diacetylchitobiose transport system permease protein n=1 Tax=Motilibacter rhizosphaerae TaxID=598652 RepID=A0A4Q7NG07_9ACTN|nr:carbohydrate ABC transporter permease [Motilibacter rhizosphaerae]RZS82840.1 N,N'-diacetylchitobiose transport system permease protein [Motilibacter rhizosphaerae]